MVRNRSTRPYSAELLILAAQLLLPTLSMQDIIEQNWTGDHLRHRHLFDEYLRGGLLPFALDEPDPIPLLANILKKNHQPRYSASHTAPGGRTPGH